jgi:hypothetical protein
MIVDVVMKIAQAGWVNRKPCRKYRHLNCQKVRKYPLPISALVFLTGKPEHARLVLELQ